MAYLSVAGTRLYYEEEGAPTGRPMFLLHAALQNGESMRPLVELLSPLGLRLIVPDMRGHGRTANPARSFSLDRLADDMVALVDHLGIRRPILAGYSLGGIVGIELARRGLLTGLVVLASRIWTAAKGRQAFDPQNIRQRSPIWAGQLAVKHVEMNWEELALELGELLSTWPGFTDEALSAIACPTLVVQGDKDLMVPLEQAQALAAAVPGAVLQVVPGAGHPDLLYRRDAMAAVHGFVRNFPG